MKSYDLSKLLSYLMYFDVNNLYGWAVCQLLPYTDFRWVDDMFNFNVMIIPLDSLTGYILEVVLEYPQHLHDVQADLPFYPTRDKPPGKRKDKFLATLYNKKGYVIHYRNLQQCICYQCLSAAMSSDTKDPSHITIRAISMASRLYPIKYRIRTTMILRKICMN